MHHHHFSVNENIFCYNASIIRDSSKIQAAYKNSRERDQNLNCDKILLPPTQKSSICVFLHLELSNSGKLHGTFDL